jgi:translocator assembly and maintenance protein 41
MFPSVVTVTRLIRISYGDYQLESIPKGMAIPVPYKPVPSQKARGSLTEQRRSPSQRNNTKQKSDKASPITWVSSVSSASFSNRRSFHSQTTTNNGSTKSNTAQPDVCLQSDDGTGQLTSEDKIREDVLSLFPQDNLVYSFGYGSGVFSQTLKNSTKKHEGMLDLILVVDDTYKFHEANIQTFPHHYSSWLRWGGPSLITKMQRRFPLKDAHVLFHVVDDPVPIKYGVVDQEDLLRDLTQWESLYLAGRLHKPTLPLLSPPDNFVSAQDQNLHAAVAAALLLSMPSSSETTKDNNFCSWDSLYRSIASLSYTGDFRMQVGGEDPQKLNKLVQAPGQLHRFQNMYRPILDSYEEAGILSQKKLTTSPSSEYNDGDNKSFYDNGIEWNASDPTTISYLCDHLPQNLLDQTASCSSNDIQKALSATVAPAARHQSFKGVFTLGFRRSIQYASAKLSKGLFKN